MFSRAMTRKHKPLALSSRSRTVGWPAAPCRPLSGRASCKLLTIQRVRPWQRVGKTGRNCSPPNGLFLNYPFDKNRIKALISWSLMHFGEKVALSVAERVKEVGFECATQAGASLGIEDLKIPPTKATLVSQAELEIQLASNLQGTLTALERFQHLIDTWHRGSESLKGSVVRHFRSTDLLNPVYMMAFSGARGNISQVGQLVGMRGLMADPKGQVISFPIRSNFREGLTLTEYVISCYGARKGLVDTALRTADAGYLTRRLVDVSQHVVVSQFDCKTNRGILLLPLLENGRDRLPLQGRLTGRVLAENISNPTQASVAHLAGSSGGNRNSPLVPLVANNRAGVVGSRNQQISHDLAEKIAALRDRVLVRSPLSCNRLNSICQLCYGWSLAEGQLVFLGEAVGVIAAQSIGEPGTQLTMRTFHTGGVFSGDVVDEIRAPCEGWIEFAAPLQGKLIRTSHGKIAFRTKAEGWLVTRASLLPANKTDLLETRIPPLTILFVRHREQVAYNQLVAEVPIRDAQGDDKVTEPFYCPSELEGKVFFESLRVRVARSRNNIKVSTSLTLGSVWVLSGQICKPVALGPSFLANGDFIDHRSILSREIGWLSWGGVASNLPPLVQNNGRCQERESWEEVLAKPYTLTQNPLCKPYHPLGSNRVARFQAAQKGGRKGYSASTLSTCLAGPAQRGKHLLPGLNTERIDINQPFLSLPSADIQYKNVGYLLSHPTNRKSSFLYPQPWLTQQPLAGREPGANQPFCLASRPEGVDLTPGTTKHDCFFVSNSLSRAFKTAFEASKSLRLQWFPTQYRTKTGTLTHNSDLYLFKGLSRGQLLWAIEEGYRVRLMPYNRGRQADPVSHASRRHQSCRLPYSAFLLWALLGCRRSHLSTTAPNREGSSVLTWFALATKSKQVASEKQANTRQTKTRPGALPRTGQLGGRGNGNTQPLSADPVAGRKGKSLGRSALVLQAKQGTERLQEPFLIGRRPATKKVGLSRALNPWPQGQQLAGQNQNVLQDFKRDPCKAQLRWVERGFVLGLQNNLQGSQVPLSAPFNGWLTTPPPLQPFSLGGITCFAHKPVSTKQHTTSCLTKNLINRCLQRGVNQSYRATIQTLSPLLLDTARGLVRRKQDRNGLAGLNLALARNRVCSVPSMCNTALARDRSALFRAREHLFCNRPRTANSVRCQTVSALNQLVKVWPAMVTRNSCPPTPLREHKSGLGAALHVRKFTLLGLLRRRSHKYRSLVQNPCRPVKLLGGGLVCLGANADRFFDHCLANLYSKKLFLWDAKQSYKLGFWAVGCGRVFDYRRAEWERKGWSLNRTKFNHNFLPPLSYTSLEAFNVWHDRPVSEHELYPFLAGGKRRHFPRRKLLLLGVTPAITGTDLAHAMQDQAATHLGIKPGLILFSRTQTSQAEPLRAQAALLHQSLLPPGLAIPDCCLQAYTPLQEKASFGRSLTLATGQNRGQAGKVVGGGGKDRVPTKFALCSPLPQRSGGLAPQLANSFLPPVTQARQVWRLTGQKGFSFNSAFVSAGSVRTFPFYPMETLRSWLQDKLCSRVSLGESKTSPPAAKRASTALSLSTTRHNRIWVGGLTCNNNPAWHKILHLSSKLALASPTDQHAAKNKDRILLLEQDLCSNQPRSGTNLTLKQTARVGVEWHKALRQGSQSNSLLLLLRLVFSSNTALNPPCLPEPQDRFLFDLYRGFALNGFRALFLVVGSKSSRWTVDCTNDRPAAAHSHSNPLAALLRYQKWCGLVGREKASHRPVPGADLPPTRQAGTVPRSPRRKVVQVARVQPFERSKGVKACLTGFSLKRPAHKTRPLSGTSPFNGKEKKHLHPGEAKNTKVNVAANRDAQSWAGLQGNMSLHPFGLKLLATTLSLVGKGANLGGNKQFNKLFSFWSPNISTLPPKQLAGGTNRTGHKPGNLASQNLNLLACKVQSRSVLPNSQHKRVIYESATCSGNVGTRFVRHGATPRFKGRETALELFKFNEKSNKQRPDEIETVGPTLTANHPLLASTEVAKTGAAVSAVRLGLGKLNSSLVLDLNLYLAWPTGTTVVAATLVVNASMLAITEAKPGIDLDLTRATARQQMQPAQGTQTNVLNLRETSFVRLLVRFQTPTTYSSTLSKSHIPPIRLPSHKHEPCQAFYANPYPLTVLNDRITRPAIDRVLLFAIRYQNRAVCGLVGGKILGTVLWNKRLHSLANPAPPLAPLGRLSTPPLARGREDNQHAKAIRQACCACLVQQNGGLARNRVYDVLSRIASPSPFGKCFHFTFFKRASQPANLERQIKVVKRRNSVLACKSGWTSKTGAVLSSSFGPYAGEVTSSSKGSGCLVLTSENQTSLSLLGNKPGCPSNLQGEARVGVGQLVRYGEKVTDQAAVVIPGQVLEITSNTLTLRKAQPVRFPRESRVLTQQGEFVKKHDHLLAVPYQKLTTGDIVQGIPRIEQLFEARQTKDGVFLPNNLADKLAGFFEHYKDSFGLQNATNQLQQKVVCLDPHLPTYSRLVAAAARKSVKRVQLLIVAKIQRVYLSQGVLIADKHLEIVARQMTSKARITAAGTAGLMYDELVDLNLVERYNSFLFQSEPVRYEPVVLGITRSSLGSRSYLSAASFQETNRVLTKAGIQPKLDLLGGLKQKVIIGDPIEAGTGYAI